jgi:hypothetical protein
MFFTKAYGPVVAPDFFDTAGESEENTRGNADADHCGNEGNQNEA